MAAPHEHPAQRVARDARERLQALRNALRDGIDAVDDPRAEALFETAAEVLGGLDQAFHDFEERNEAAWRANA